MKKQRQLSLTEAFINADRLQMRINKRCISSFGLHEGDFRILMYLYSRDETAKSQRSIAESFDISSAAVAVTLKRMERDGLIERSHPSSDNRANTVVLTAKGKKIIKNVMAYFDKMQNMLLSEFTDEEIASMTGFLNKFSDIVSRFDLMSIE